MKEMAQITKQIESYKVLLVRFVLDSSRLFLRYMICLNWTCKPYFRKSLNKQFSDEYSPLCARKYVPATFFYFNTQAQTILLAARTSTVNFLEKSLR